MEEQVTALKEFARTSSTELQDSQSQIQVLPMHVSLAWTAGGVLQVSYSVMWWSRS